VLEEGVLEVGEVEVGGLNGKIVTRWEGSIEMKMNRKKEEKCEGKVSSKRRLAHAMKRVWRERRDKIVTEESMKLV